MINFFERGGRHRDHPDARYARNLTKAYHRNLAERYPWHAYTVQADYAQYLAEMDIRIGNLANARLGARLDRKGN